MRHRPGHRVLPRRVLQHRAGGRGQPHRLRGGHRGVPRPPAAGRQRAGHAPAGVRLPRAAAGRPVVRGGGPVAAGVRGRAGRSDRAGRHPRPGPGDHPVGGAAEARRRRPTRPQLARLSSGVGPWRGATAGDMPFRSPEFRPRKPSSDVYPSGNDSSGGDMKARMGWAAGAVVLGAALMVAPRVSAATAQQWQLGAPGGTGPRVTVSLDPAGHLSLGVRRGTTQVLQSSALGIRTRAADLSTGLAFTGRADAHVTDTYGTPTGRRRQHSTDANQTTLSFSKGSARLDVVFRVSTDGLGYRYVIRGSGQVAVTGEASEYVVPTSAKAVLLPYFTGRNDYENVHVHTTVGQATPTEYGYPSLFHVADTWLLVTESDLNGTYGGSRLTLNRTNRHFQLTLPDPVETSAAPLTTPWRTMILGDLATVSESDLVTDLASPSKVVDASWVRPGRAAWSWWSKGSSAGSLTAQEQYTDFAAKMGWEYVLVDAGWDASWIPTLVRYAKARHVGVWIWTNQPMNDTAAKINSNFKLWKSWGVVGLKVDHIRSEQQVRMQWYDQVLAASARYQLMIDLDGSMDYTPVTFTAKRTNTDAAELAQAIVFESGLQNYADSVASYDAHPLAERLLKLVPNVWDQTRLLSGNPDTHVILARRNATNWYIGGITAGPGRTFTQPLDFLATGNWLADIYSDGTKGALALHTERVTSASTLTIKTLTKGGFSVLLCPAHAGQSSCG